MIEGWTKDHRRMIGYHRDIIARRVGAGMPQVGLRQGFTMNYPWLYHDFAMALG